MKTIPLKLNIILVVFCISCASVIPVNERKLVNGLGMTFVYIPPGSFLMGSPCEEEGHESYEKRRIVHVTHGFYMQTTEVTQSQWEGVTGNNPSHFDSPKGLCPVENVSWEDLQQFIEKLNESETTNHYRLPTEAEWEYACRAGTTTPFSFGKCITTDEANFNGKQPMFGCSKGVYRKKTTPVASFPPNQWGLYDMHGNVWELCYDKNIYERYENESTQYRMIRGGAYHYYPVMLRSALSNSIGQKVKRNDIGFRLVISDIQSCTDDKTTHYISEQDDKKDDCLKEKPAEYTIIKNLLNSNEELDQAAISDFVSDIKANYSIPIFINALRDNNYEYRGGAALILGILKYKKSIPKLLQMAINDPTPLCRGMATWALYEIGEQESKDQALTNFFHEFNDPETEASVKGILAMFLGDIQDKRATPYLIAALNDKSTNTFVQEFVIRALQDIKDERATSALIEFASRQDEKSYFQSDAFMSLGLIGSDDAITFLSDTLNSQNCDYHTRVNAATALGYTSNHSQQAISSLIKATKDSNRGIRFVSVDALGQISDEQAIKAVVDALNDQSEQVRFKAVTVLGDVGSETTIPALKKMLTDHAIFCGKPISEHAEKSIEQIEKRLFRHSNGSIQYIVPRRYRSLETPHIACNYDSMAKAELKAKPFG